MNRTIDTFLYDLCRIKWPKSFSLFLLKVQNYFGRSKLFWMAPHCFGWLQIVLVGSKLSWLGPNNFGWVQIRFFWTNFYNLDLSKMIWTQPRKIGLSKMISTKPKLFGWSRIILDPYVLSFYGSKMILDPPNNFGPVRVQFVLVKSKL